MHGGVRLTMLLLQGLRMRGRSRGPKGDSTVTSPALRKPWLPDLNRGSASSQVQCVWDWTPTDLFEKRRGWPGANPQAPPSAPR